MALETGNYVGDLVVANPAAADPKSQGDDHLRLIKTAVRQSFPGFTGAILAGTAVTGGAANAYTMTPATALVTYVSPMLVAFSPVATNTGACTLAISGLATTPLRSVIGDELTSGELVAGDFYIAAYTGTEFRLIAPTKQYVDQRAFQTALPLQSGHAGQFLTTDGTNASWQDLFGKFVALATVL